MTKKPKLLIASDGKRTAIFLDGVVLGQGIERLELSTLDKDGKYAATIRLLEVNVEAAKVDARETALEQMLDGLAKE